MLIECPACHARSKLPESKEGAKVRCGSCSRVFVARDVHRRGGSGGGPGPAVWIVIAVVALGGIVLFARGRAKDDGDPVVAGAETSEPEPEPELLEGWEAAPVQAAVRIHERALLGDAAALAPHLDTDALWARARAEARDAGEPEPGPERFGLLPGAARAEWIERWGGELLAGDTGAILAAWEPFDGDLKLRGGGDRAVVLLELKPRAGGVELRRFEWTMNRVGSSWKAAAWYALPTADELAEKEKVERGYDKVELSDGSVVLEREPEPLGHLEDTPPEQREHIDELLATMFDPESGRAGTAAMIELQEIGKPVVPLLLTHLYENPIETDEQQIQAHQAVNLLREITGQHFGFEPMIAEGSAFGTTLERRTSSIKQWFAWWYRKGEKFEEREEEPDAFEELLRAEGE